MNPNVNFNQKQIYSEPIYVKSYINLRFKVKAIENHNKLPIFVFCDEEFNVYVYNILDNKILRGFNMQSISPDDYKIKTVSFMYFSSDKSKQEKFLLQEQNKKVKGIPFLVRDYVIILILEKQILFYNIITRNVINSINFEQLGKKSPIKAENIDDDYLIILNSDGKY